MKKLICVFLIVIVRIFSNEAFFKAVENNNLKETETFIKKGVNVNIKEPWFGKTALMIASSYDYEGIVDLLLKNGANPDMQTKDGYTALMYAFENNSAKSLKVLSDKKQNLDLKNSEGDTILHMAIKKNSENLARVLLEKGANIDEKDRDGNTPILISIENMYDNFIKLFAFKGADLTISSKKGEKPIFLAIAKGNLLMVRILAEEKLQLEEKNALGQTPLAAAIYLGNKEIVKVLLDAEVETNYRDKDGNTYLHMNSLYGNVEILDLLMGKKIKVDEKNREGNTALMLAAKNNQTLITKRLLQLGANFETLNNQGKNSLVLAKESDAKDVVEFFKTIENDMMKTLLLAIKENKLNEVIRLLERGIEINSTDLKGESLLYKIIDTQNIELLEYFLEKKAKITKKELIKAVDTKNLEIIRTFVSHGITLYPKEKFEESLVYRALKNGDLPITKYLLENGPKEYKENKSILDLGVNTENDELIRYLLDGAYPINTLNKDLLFWSIKNNKIELCEKFLKNTSNMSLKDRDKRSLIMISVVYDVKEIFNLLISKGGDVAEKDERGYTLLMLAAENNSVKTGELLVKEEFSLEAAMIIAVQKDSIDMVKLLQKKGVKIKGTDEKDVNYLMLAAKSNSMKVFEYLLEKGIDPDDRDKNGENSLMYAARGGSLDIMKLLIEKGQSKKIKNRNGENLIDISKTIDIRNYLVSQGFK